MAVDRDPKIDFRDEKRSDAIEAQSIRRPSCTRRTEYTEAKLLYITHVLTKNRHGPIVDVETTQGTDKAEEEAGQRMIRRIVSCSGTVGADQGYDQARYKKYKMFRDSRSYGHLPL